MASGNELDIFRPSRQLRRATLFWLSLVLAAMSMLVAIVNVYVGPFYTLAYIEAMFCTFSLYVGYCCYHGRHSNTLAVLYIYSVVAIISVATYSHPVAHGLFVWAFLYPVLFYLILGRRQGFIATAIGFSLQLVIISQKSGDTALLDYFHLSINFALAFAAVWITAHVLEVKRKTSEASLGHLASRDALTGVYNRHALVHNFERYRRESQTLPLSLLILDLDYFKQVNDQFGHDVGDKVLIQTAALIDALSDEHLVYRIGGEEFCVALHNTDLPHAMQKAEQIRATIERANFHSREEPIHLTVSIGVYQCDHYHDLESVLREADKELYRAKQNGRNQVMVCNEAAAS